jgi:hypothetical protein
LFVVAFLASKPPQQNVSPWQLVASELVSVVAMSFMGQQNRANLNRLVAKHNQMKAAVAEAGKHARSIGRIIDSIDAEDQRCKAKAKMAVAAPKAKPKMPAPAPLLPQSDEDSDGGSVDTLPPPQAAIAQAPPAAPKKAAPKFWPEDMPIPLPNLAAPPKAPEPGKANPVDPPLARHSTSQAAPLGAGGTPSLDAAACFLRALQEPAGPPPNTPPFARFIPLAPSPASIAAGTPMVPFNRNGTVPFIKNDAKTETDNRASGSSAGSKTNRKWETDRVNWEWNKNKDWNDGDDDDRDCAYEPSSWTSSWTSSAYGH